MNWKEILQQNCSAGTYEIHSFRGMTRATVRSNDVYKLLEQLRRKGDFDFLVDITAVDYLDYPGARDRFGVVYILLKTKDSERLVVRTFVNDPDPKLPSVVNVWPGADWMEREVFDMFGISFAGHPDLRRILMPEEFTAFPLRKDYPLRGLGERHNFPVITRAES
jgi:NADH-quinone oxidoreductase subunit C